MEGVNNEKKVLLPESERKKVKDTMQDAEEKIRCQNTKPTTNESGHG